MDRNAFEKMTEHYSKDIYGFCLHLAAGRRDHADDLYQDTIVKAYQIKERIAENQNPKAFILAIAISLWKSHIRKEHRRNRIAPQFALEEENWDIEDRGNHPEDMMLKKEEGTFLHNALARLEDKYRIPLVLFYFNQFDLEEISNICNMPIGTVKSRLFRGRERLKKQLQKEGYQYE